MKVYDGETERRPLEAEYDYVIVGSGAAGATAARVLADTGDRIVVVEEGPAVRTEDFGDEVFPAMRRMFRDQGSLLARGRAFLPVLQGTCLGGSTVVNSAIMWRIPDDVWLPWRDELGLGPALPLEALHACWDQIEQELHIRTTPRVIFGGHNHAMERGRARLGIEASPTRRAANGCRGSARCLTGCPSGAKQSMLVSYLPYAAERGATLITRARVERIEWVGSRATAVRGHFHAPGQRRIAPFRIRAKKAVLVGASAIQTPGLLAKSGVRSAHLGRHFQAHPGCPLTARFDAPINMWSGATQGYDADHHRADLRFKIETISLPPEIAFARFPGVGASWLKAIADSPHLAIWGIQLRAYAEGSVRERFYGTDIRYDLELRDMLNLRRALRFAAELFFAAGAREIWPGIHGLPERLISPEEVAVFDRAPLDPRAYSFILSHLFGTARMSVRPSAGVIGPDFAVHGTENLFVIDSSTFPTNLGVNPQEAIMGLAMHAARGIAARFSA